MAEKADEKNTCPSNWRPIFSAYVMQTYQQTFVPHLNLSTTCNTGDEQVPVSTHVLSSMSGVAFTSRAIFLISSGSELFIHKVYPRHSPKGSTCKHSAVPFKNERGLMRHRGDQSYRKSGPHMNTFINSESENKF
jgi:hypothetical protein